MPWGSQNNTATLCTEACRCATWNCGAGLELRCFASGFGDIVILFWTQLFCSLDHHRRSIFLFADLRLPLRPSESSLPLPVAGASRTLGWTEGRSHKDVYLLFFFFQNFFFSPKHFVLYKHIIFFHRCSLFFQCVLLFSRFGQITGQRPWICRSLRAPLQRTVELEITFLYVFIDIYIVGFYGK